MFEETPSVRMKGVGDSLWVTVAPEATLEVIQAELTRLFEPSKIATMIRGWQAPPG